MRKTGWTVSYFSWPVAGKQGRRLAWEASHDKAALSGRRMRQYSLGSRIAVDDLSASVMTHIWTLASVSLYAENTRLPWMMASRFAVWSALLISCQSPDWWRRKRRIGSKLIDSSFSCAPTVIVHLPSENSTVLTWSPYSLPPPLEAGTKRSCTRTWSKIIRLSMNAKFL